ncbi:hypothetical protein SNE40_015020 [Patella caerulea]|uniref:Uncharacterized protein n=1 Tax=Patella caerulea TaxID=87958 RepID=A0AAN8PK15_PATCE
MTSVHFENVDSASTNEKENKSGETKSENVNGNNTSDAVPDFIPQTIPSRYVFDKNHFEMLCSKYQILPHVGHERILNITGSSKDNNQQFPGFCLNLRSIEGIAAYLNLAAGTSALYQVSVSLFDLKFKCFFGRQWIGPAVPCGESKKVKYKQNVYFHTSLKNSNIVAVIEVIVNTTDELTGRIKKLSCGWGIIRLFKYNEELPDSTRTLPLNLQT